MNYVIVNNHKTNFNHNDNYDIANDQEITVLINTKNYLLDCRSSYKTWKDVLNQYKLDVGRMNIIHNFEEYYRPDKLYQSIKKHKILTCLCTQSSFLYHFVTIHNKYTSIESDIYVLNTDAPIISITDIDDKNMHVNLAKKLLVMYIPEKEILMYIDTNLEFNLTNAICHNVNKWFSSAQFDQGSFSWKIKLCENEKKIKERYETIT